jgi:hypothetical protein
MYNDDVTRFPVTTIRLYFHNTTDMLKYLTKGPEVGLPQAVQKISFAAQTCDKKTAENYSPPAARRHIITVMFYASCAADLKPNGYLPLFDSGNITKL